MAERWALKKVLVSGNSHFHFSWEELAVFEVRDGYL